MAISISVLNDKKIAIVTYTAGTVSKQGLTRQRKQVSDTLMKNKIQKVLVDTSNLDKLPSSSTLLLHNRAVAEEEPLHNAKFAVLCARLGQDEQFLETSGINRGLRIKCFTSREEALSWLD